MKKILITGAGSYVGESVRNYILKTAPERYLIDVVDTMGDNWKKADYSQYDVVFHCTCKCGFKDEVIVL